MNKEEKIEFKRLCAQFLNFKEYVHTDEKELKFYNECYDGFPEHIKAYRVPLNFPFEYKHPTEIYMMYNNPQDVPVQTKRVSLADLKFDSDWNWIMKVCITLGMEFVNTNKEQLIQQIYDKLRDMEINS